MLARWNFDPSRLAELEAAGWEAYYGRNWLRAFWLLVQLSREQFHLHWISAFRAAYYVTKASIAFAPKENDLPTTRQYLEKFYRKTGAQQGYNSDSIADLELRYWIVHRELVGKTDKTGMVQALTELHSALFGLPREKVVESARLRSMAAETVDLITSHTSSHPQADWQRIREYLSRAYSDIRRNLDDSED